MKNNIKALELVKSGLSPKTVFKLTESQINTLHKKMISEQVTQVSKTDTNSINQLKQQKKPFQLYEKDEVEEGKPKKGEPNPWAICHAQVGPKKTRKFERCVQAVKKSLKEGKNPVSLFLENEIMRIVEKHIPPRITKSDLIDYIFENTETKPKEKPKTKPGEKTSPGKKPLDPFKPSPHKQPPPKAKKEETKEAVMDAPAKPKEKPTTKPGEKTPTREKPLDPFKPSPHKQPKPKAKKVPEWLTFKNMGIRFKK